MQLSLRFFFLSLLLIPLDDSKKNFTCFAGQVSNDLQKPIKGEYNTTLPEVHTADFLQQRGQCVRKRIAAILNKKGGHDHVTLSTFHIFK